MTLGDVEHAASMVSIATASTARMPRMLLERPTAYRVTLFEANSKETLPVAVAMGSPGRHPSLT